MTKRFYVHPQTGRDYSSFLYWGVYDKERHELVPDLNQCMSKFQARRVARVLNSLWEKRVLGD